MTTQLRYDFILIAALSTTASGTPILLHAQSYPFLGEGAGDRLGWSVAGAGDINNDGYDDFVAGAPFGIVDEEPRGYARVYSGFDGSVLYTFFGENANDQFGRSVSGAGDINKDGHADIIVGIIGDDANGIDSGSAQVISGQDGSILLTFFGNQSGDYLGWAVANAGDVNADGTDDLIVGTWGDENQSNTATTLVYSGIDGTTLYTIPGVGYSVSTAGDINRDGYADFISGAPHDGVQAGNAKVFSGLDGSILHTFASAYSVSAAGDVNNDGCDDVIVGNRTGEIGQIGIARVYSGLDGMILHTLHGVSPNDLFGQAVAGIGDVNGDDFDDVVVGAPADDNGNANGGFDSGSVRIFSGFDGTIIYEYNGRNAGENIGWAISRAGDVNDDGFSDFVEGTRGNYSGSNQGSVRVYISNVIPEMTLPCPGNLTNDAVVNVDDLNEVLSNWGSVCQ